MSKPVLGLLAGLALVSALGEARKRGSRDVAQQACRPGLRTSLQTSLASAPDGPLPLNKWIELLQSRGVVRQQMETRGMLAWIEAQRKAGRKSLTKSDLLAWAKDNPFAVQVVWKGPPLGGKLTAQQRRVQDERERLMREIKRLLLNEGLSSAEADLVMASPKQHVAQFEGGYFLTLKPLPHDGYVRSIAFSPDGRLIGTASDDQKARLWRADGTLVATLPHDGVVRSIAFSPDGRLIGTASGDQKAWLWRADGTLVATLPHDGYVTSIAFSPDGRLIGTASDNQKARLWRAEQASSLASGLFDLTKLSSTGSKWSEYVAGEPDAYRELLLVLPPVGGRDPFTRYSHWAEPDVLAHARITLRGDVLFIDEIQSDWHQGLAGRKEVPASEFPGGPGRNEPPVPFASDWERLVLKHLLAYAVEVGVDTVALTDAATIAPVVGGDKASLSGFYDKRLLDVFSALVKRLGGSVERVKVKGFRKTFPGVRMTPALRRAICSGFDLWGKT